jgi:hypothetical protein
LQIDYVITVTPYYFPVFRNGDMAKTGCAGLLLSPRACFCALGVRWLRGESVSNAAFGFAEALLGAVGIFNVVKDAPAHK